MSASEFVPFLHSKADCEIFKRSYSSASIWRICLDRVDMAQGSDFDFNRAWIDTGFDGFVLDEKSRGDKWKEFIKPFGDTDFLRDSTFLKKPSVDKLRPLVFALLDKAFAKRPGYLSVPQFPHVDGVEHNKMNRVLCDLTIDWRNQNQACRSKFILPILFTNQRQLVGKTERGPKVKLAASLITRSGADGFWSVDCSLDDQKGTGNYEKERFPGVLDFFDELNTLCPLTIRIGGPYWGLNLILWARGLATHYGVGIGSTYNHHISGGFARKTNTRIALPPLRRWAVANNELEVWLAKAAKKLPPGSVERNELEQIEKDFAKLLVGDAGKRQIAQFYRDWISKIENVSPTGRSLALYQDLSSAFVTGRPLPELPKGEGTARRPERVAQQLMINCL